MSLATCERSSPLTFHAPITPPTYHPGGMTILPFSRYTVHEKDERHIARGRPGPRVIERRQMDPSIESPKLDRPAWYEIKVPGRLEEHWSEWLEGMAVEVESQDQGPTITTLTGEVPDLAALQGLINRLYSMGLSLISVNLVPPSAK